MKRTRGLLLATGLLAAVLTAAPNCGSSGGSSGGVPTLPKVAVLTNEAASPYAADVVEKLEAEGKFSRIDTINAASLTPSLVQLRAYDGILVYTGDNGPDIADTTTLGDVLADYVDQGGGVVAAWAAVIYDAENPGFALGGRYVSEEYYLIPRVGSVFGRQVSSAVFDSTHPILEGFNTFDGGSDSSRADTSRVVSTARVILEWEDGTPLVVVSEVAGIGSDRRRVDLNFYPPSSEVPDISLWDAATDGGKLLANSLLWVAEQP